MDSAYVSALAALAGALIGGLTSFATSWLTQRTQLRHAHREAERADMKALYSDFITEAAHLFGDALSQQTEEISRMVGLHALIGRMRLVSDQTVIDAAARTEGAIIRTYLGPNRTLHEVMGEIDEGKLTVLSEFSEACRKDLAARLTAVR